MHRFNHSAGPWNAPSETPPRDHFSTADAFQDSETFITDLLQQFSSADFEPSAIAFPADVCGIYTDIQVLEHQLRAYAIVSLSERAPSLFLILGPRGGSYLPMGSRLSVSENNLLLSEQGTFWTESSTYIYTQVFGNWEEKFTISVLLPNARLKVLAPLMFDRRLSTSQDSALTIVPFRDRFAA